MKKLIIVLLLFFVLLNFVSADDGVCEIGDEVCSVGSDDVDNNVIIKMDHDDGLLCIVYFYGEGCNKCAKIKPFIDEIEVKYGGKVHISRLEIYHNLNNYNAYNRFCGINGIVLEERGIPLVAIGNDYLMGVSAIEDNLEIKIEEYLGKERMCPLDTMNCHDVNITKGDSEPIVDKKISLPLVLATGLIDGINPCAFAVLIFLLMFLFEISGSRKRMFKAGMVYILAVYITYFVAGFGLLSVIQFSGFSGVIFKIAAILAILFGLVNLKDYFWYGKGFSLKIPELSKGVIEKWTKKANIPAAIVLGFLVSMFELPCTGGVYLAILAMLASSVTKVQAIGYLLIYNLMFILPLIIILVLVLKGMKAEHLENWRKSKRNLMKLLLGLLMLVLGIGMLLGWF
ncbi:MAG: cytochrome c biogenesis protein [Nanoarchaeota archaeon]|nr:cytochrome c biogenesis protein [Nanoarchaeota archaeon]